MESEGIITTDVVDAATNVEKVRRKLKKKVKESSAVGNDTVDGSKVEKYVQGEGIEGENLIAQENLGYDDGEEVERKQVRSGKSKKKSQRREGVVRHDDGEEDVNTQDVKTARQKSGKRRRKKLKGEHAS